MMSKFPVVGSKKLIRFFKAEDFLKEPRRGRGSHTMMSKDGIDEMVVIPHTRAVTIGIIKDNLKIAGISEDYFRAAMQGGKKSR